MLCIRKMFLLCLRCAMNKLLYCVYTLTPSGVQSAASATTLRADARRVPGGRGGVCPRILSQVFRGTKQPRKVTRGMNGATDRGKFCRGGLAGQRDREKVT